MAKGEKAGGADKESKQIKTNNRVRKNHWKKQENISKKRGPDRKKERSSWPSVGVNLEGEQRCSGYCQ